MKTKKTEQKIEYNLQLRYNSRALKISSREERSDRNTAFIKWSMLQKCLN